MSVHLFDCDDDNNTLKTAETDTRGYYEFELLSSGNDGDGDGPAAAAAANGNNGNNGGGGYYISLPNVPSWYVLTDVWSGAWDDASIEQQPRKPQSVVDPATSSSACFDAPEGEATSASAGLKFYVAPPPTMEPTTEPTEEEKAPPSGTPAPSGKPTSLPVATPAPTQQAVKIGGYAFLDANDNGRFDPDFGEARLPGIRVSLTSCSSNGDDDDNNNASLATATTDSEGYYRFDLLVEELVALPGSYRATFAYCPDPSDVDACYAGSSRWSGSGGGTDNVFEPAAASPDAHSDADPATGSTVCKGYGGAGAGADLDVNAGMRLATEGPTTKPTNAPTKRRPTLKPTVTQQGQQGGVQLQEPREPSLTLTPTISPTLQEQWQEQEQEQQQEQEQEQQQGPTVDDLGLSSPSATQSPSTGDGGSSIIISPTFTDDLGTPAGNETSNATLVAEALEPHGPVTTERLVMTIRGIGGIDTEDLWATKTAEFIDDYFNTGDGSEEGGVVDLVSSIAVSGQKSTTTKRMLREHNIVNDEKNDGKANGRQMQGAKSLEITYSLTSTYKTPNATQYDHMYVATKPFECMGCGDSYIELLQSVHPNATGIMSMSIRQKPAPVVKAAAAEDDGGSSNIPVIVGSVCAVLLLVATTVVIALRRRKLKRGDAYLEPVGNGPASSMPDPRDLARDGDSNDDGRGDGSASDSSSFGSDSESSYEYETMEAVAAPGQDYPSEKPFAAPGEDFPLASLHGSDDENGVEQPKSRSLFGKALRRSNKSDADEVLNGLPDNSISSNDQRQQLLVPGSEMMLHIVAPPGRLGIIVDSHPQGGPAYVCEIRSSCPIADVIKLEDKIIAVDDEDVQKMTAVNISKLLARRARNQSRKITVLREGMSDSLHSVQTAESVGMDIDRADDLLQAMPGDRSVVESSSMMPMMANLVDDNNDTGWSNGNGNEGAVGASHAEEKIVHIIAPSGKLGVVLVTPGEQSDRTLNTSSSATEGPPYVFNIRDESPLKGKVHLNDKIIAVDDEDVSSMTAINVSKLLGSKSSHYRRKITVLREIKGGDEATEAVRLTVDTIYTTGAVTTARSSESASNVMTMPSNPELERSSGSSSSSTSDSTNSDAQTRIIIVAPPGKLGVVVDSPPDGGLAYVSGIKTESPLMGQIMLGDRIMEVDGEDVSKLKAIHVSMLLGSKSRNARREITVLRLSNDE